MKRFYSTVLAISICFYGFSQIFQDNVANETLGDFPSQWDLVAGMATIDQQDGYKMINIAHGGIIKPIVTNQTNNYINGDFTVEFDIFFDQTSSLYGQRFVLRLWDGAYGYQNNDIRYKPFVIYRDGLETDWNQPEMGSAKNHLTELQTLDAVWRHVKVELKDGKLKISLDDQMILFLPRFKMQPTMVSLGGGVNDSKFSAKIGFTNFKIESTQDANKIDQIKFNRNIPNEAHEKMEEFMSSGIQAFSFSQNGGWVIVTRTNNFFARNIPQQCYDKLKDYREKGIQIKDVVFPTNMSDNSWLIITEKETYSRNIPQDCYEKIKELENQGSTISSVSFTNVNVYDPSKTGWVILDNKGSYHAKMIPDECYQIMRNITQSDMPNIPSDRKLTRITFSRSGGWVVIAEDYVFARNIPDELFEKLGEFRKQGYNPSILSFDADGDGWSIVSDKRRKEIPINKIRELEDDAGGGLSIWDLMRQRNVPGITIAMVINGKIAWKTGYGHLIVGDPRLAAHPESMFQAASISKVFAAVGALKMIDDNKISLTENLMTSGKLKTNIPFHQCVKNASWTQNFNKLTIQNILQHQSGIDGRGAVFKSDCSFEGSEDGGGYGGYKSLNQIPSLDDLLKSITINYDYTITPTPNSKSSWYSGKAFTVLQKLTEDVTNASYPIWMQQNILRPLGMDKSGFVINPENKYGEFSRGHNSNGEAWDVRRYPQYAAAGLYSNVEELSNLIIMINNGGIYNSKRILSDLSMTRLINNNMGINVNSSKTRYSHGGTNTGFKALLTGFRKTNNQLITNAGIVVMVNGDDFTDTDNDGEDDRTQIRNLITSRLIAIYGL